MTVGHEPSCCPSAAAAGDDASVQRAKSSGGISGGDAHYAWAVSGLHREIREANAVLDLGCGVGFFGTYLREQFICRPHGLDLVRHEGFREENYQSFAQRNLETLEFAGQPFDLIFAIGLVEYFPNPRAFVRSLPAMLAPGGHVILTAPNPASLGSILSLLVRGECSAFRESSNPASITPVLAVDAVRMFREAGFGRVVVDYSARGRVPMLGTTTYQRYLPALRGRLWSDNFRLVASLA